ncbi:MAG TPA: anthranilate/aminodeoxychorismate synthase component II [Elusimicrobia bacterium]|nr:MAG: anthranilate/aminodeoxychorismate synthase component II [Elusimicrobia bacterium RIFOXYA12_FULL_49_49]OGS09237.1 MAG: anthranilate/aminodeoxychorismate synthase component II [Elusimicrobia bacterium RIFOXYA1_FULL_47_7]OGS09336.1 MAG: anthranilate/aminodeoxychorismate synthase component II [Elusimicrobia bacterium RIFOXYB1_FULL_48_9]OGS16842.1 MAG: anthranilate/aminodeoxychorismate synthase component II [Elusimicrobia bacterium RIFOXYA2_FULL_47_53]OGS32070.1 MAG: anthranilate/aminodeoxyc
MILVIDNYDSFVYNIVQYLGEWEKNIRVFRNSEISLEEIERMNPDWILISPGPGNPKQAGISLDLIKRFAGKIPIFGVCLGLQCIGEAFGGRIVRAKTLMHGKTSMIKHDGKTIFKNLPNPFEATRYHSLLVDKKTLPDCLKVSAVTKDGEIMGLRHKTLMVEGVQFHPESILTHEGKKLLRNFFNNCKRLKR